MSLLQSTTFSTEKRRLKIGPFGAQLSESRKAQYLRQFLFSTSATKHYGQLILK